MLDDTTTVGQYTIVCLYDTHLTHAWVQVFIEVFRFAIERFIYCNIKELRFFRQTRRHVRKTRLGAWGALPVAPLAHS